MVKLKNGESVTCAVCQETYTCDKPEGYRYDIPEWTELGKDKFLCSEHRDFHECDICGEACIGYVHGECLIERAREDKELTLEYHGEIPHCPKCLHVNVKPLREKNVIQKDVNGRVRFFKTQPCSCWKDGEGGMFGFDKS